MPRANLYKRDEQMVKSSNTIFPRLPPLCEAFASGFFCDMSLIINVFLSLVKSKIAMPSYNVALGNFSKDFFALN